MSYIYIIFSFIIIILGLLGIIIKKDLIIKLFFLSIFQSGVLLFFTFVAYDENIPIISQQIRENFSDPLIHSFLLTVIVIGFATISLSLVYIMILAEKFKTHNVEIIEEELEK
ncbi:NADH-ubiquinone oxidoreductase subunit 4L [Marinitoga sp. 1135]|uniref:Multisubunit Na+/H+ antiporter, MnhC subunit n=1 Tax=Marinitoga piezophila (strain DSM 14283 / JCM 11233 / KA3) TaxID=443254 RepID=H2J3J2_MARPK|nr:MULTISPECIES: NADH-quinone oxidoreductase subunit K [Marinitoga]AEX84636.1 multisubunit Na+/H+ antiporter, MnhC subunit [Marinitoga piezophila KA3]NUU94927.1 NADH-ubiquinone oxidoreductase subunit 4L [Marinitoga sp. 1135]